MNYVVQYFLLEEFCFGSDDLYVNLIIPLSYVNRNVSRIILQTSRLHLKHNQKFEIITTIMIYLIVMYKSSLIAIKI